MTVLGVLTILGCILVLIICGVAFSILCGDTTSLPAEYMGAYEDTLDTNLKYQEQWTPGKIIDVNDTEEVMAIQNYGGFATEEEIQAQLDYVQWKMELQTLQTQMLKPVTFEGRKFRE